jgi:hypothetical protein
MNEDDLKRALMDELTRRPEEFKGRTLLGQNRYGKNRTLKEIESFAARLKLEIAHHKFK